MVDNVTITAGTGTTIAADEIVDATLGTVKVQYVKLMDGTLDGTAKVTVKGASTLPVASDPSLVVSVSPNSAGLIATGTPQAPASSILSVQGPATTRSRINAAGSTNATSLKASAGQMFALKIKNVAAYAVFFKLYDKASAPTVGTDTPIWTIPLNAGEGYSDNLIACPYPFTLGIAYAITKLQADSDTTVVVAGDLTGTVQWA
jgi:hypothetical protein